MHLHPHHHPTFDSPVALLMLAIIIAALLLLASQAF